MPSSINLPVGDSLARCSFHYFDAETLAARGSCDELILLKVSLARQVAGGARPTRGVQRDRQA